MESILIIGTRVSSGPLYLCLTTLASLLASPLVVLVARGSVLPACVEDYVMQRVSKLQEMILLLEDTFEDCQSQYLLQHQCVGMPRFNY